MESEEKSTRCGTSQSWWRVTKDCKLVGKKKREVYEGEEVGVGAKMSTMVRLVLGRADGVGGGVW